MKCAIFHDDFGAIGGAEKVTVCMAKPLGAEIITINTRGHGELGLPRKCISLGETVGLPPLKQISAKKASHGCYSPVAHSFFIFSGSWPQYFVKPVAATSDDGGE